MDGCARCRLVPVDLEQRDEFYVDCDQLRDHRPANGNELQPDCGFDQLVGWAGCFFSSGCGSDRERRIAIGYKSVDRALAVSAFDFGR